MFAFLVLKFDYPSYLYILNKKYYYFHYKVFYYLLKNLINNWIY